MSGPLRIYRACFGECLGRLVWPTVVLAALTAWIATDLGGSGDPRIDATATWLHLPAMLLSALTVGAVLDAWPLFSRDRPGAALLERLPNGLLDGCAVASLGGLTALGLDGPEVLPIYLGDDRTDEDAFAALRGRGLGILVTATPRPTLADYSLQDPEEVRDFLARLAASLDSRSTT